MTAREIIEAEDPKRFLKQAPAPDTSRMHAYRFCISAPVEGVETLAFCFSITAHDEDQAVIMANDFYMGLENTFEVDEGAGAVFHLPDIQLTAAHIEDVV